MKKTTRDELIESIVAALHNSVEQAVNDALDKRDYELMRIRRATPRDSNVWAVRNEYGEIEFIKRGGIGTLMGGD